ncbi:1-acyl-sn-glycerol-3-phosphate acyltransferase [Pendulispora rubella]|uniref:1-acyl-sn-glycerol-3-phosphate acyltransferase n=1 Tax=Pendulispora rubella TaxID=2741070 RepID=A0ABZ2L3E5_9BACT
MKIRDAALGIYTHMEFGACVTAFLPIIAASHFRHRHDPTLRMPARWAQRVGRASSALTPLWDFTIEGNGPPDISNKPYVVVANHESQADPFLLSCLPWDMRWVVKEELFKIPVVGWAMSLGGEIPLRRGDGHSVRTMLAECERAIEAGISVMIFPEGTLTKSRDTLAFRDGAFDLAIRTKAPVLPVVVAGTDSMLPRHSFWIGRGRAAARILPPIPTAHMTAGDIGTLRDGTRDAMMAALADLRPRYAVPRDHASARPARTSAAARSPDSTAPSMKP